MQRRSLRRELESSQESPGCAFGAAKQVRLYALSQYAPGERISFEVDNVNRYGDAWFRDSKSGENKVAWNKTNATVWWPLNWRD